MVREDEIGWILRQCPLVHDPTQLRIDYPEEADSISAGFRERGLERFLPLLAWPGVATRWRLFLDWLDASRHAPGELPDVLTGFARRLGRLTSYRALALTSTEFETFWKADSLLPTGRLHADAATLRKFLQIQGVRSVIRARVDGPGSLPLDPSLSLHDHPETAVCVAAGRLEPPDRVVYRLELDLPAIETLGWRLCDVTGRAEWFRFRDIWFDGADPRTERFMLLEIPRLGRRCRSVRTFETPEEIGEYLRPFAEEQERRRALASPPPAP